MKKVLILGGDADHNLGDAAIFEALCCALRTVESDVQITSVGGERRTASRNPVLAIPRGAKGFARLLDCARRQDLVIIGGGGLFQDDDSRIKMPYWAIRTALMRSLNTRIVGYCLGAGPLAHSESRLFARLACASMQSISARDGFAQDWLQRCTRRTVDLIPDPAFMLPPSPAVTAARILEESKLPQGPIIGVALRRWFHDRGGWMPHKVRSRLGLGRGAGRANMASFLDALAKTLETLSKRLGCGVLLMPSYDLAHEGDVSACGALADKLRGKVPVGLADITSAGDYKAVAGSLRLMISARMHPLIFAASMGTPVVGLAYNGKFEGLFDLLGLPRRLVWLDEFRTSSPAERIVQMALDALDDATDLRKRTTELAGVTERYTAALLHGPRTDAG